MEKPKYPAGGLGLGDADRWRAYQDLMAEKRGLLAMLACFTGIRVRPPSPVHDEIMIGVDWDAGGPSVS